MFTVLGISTGILELDGWCSVSRHQGQEMLPDHQSGVFLRGGGCAGAGMLIFNHSPLGTITEIGENNKIFPQFLVLPTFITDVMRESETSPCQQHIRARVGLGDGCAEPWWGG